MEKFIWMGNIIFRKNFENSSNLPRGVGATFAFNEYCRIVFFVCKFCLIDRLLTLFVG